MWSSWYLYGTPSNRILIDLSTSTIQTCLVLCFPKTVGRFFYSFLFYKALLLTSEFPTFYEQFSWYVWILHHQVQWRKYHVIFWHYRALSFSMIHFCFALRLDASDICFHISGHARCRVLRSFVSSSVSSRTMYTRQVAFHSRQWILWNPSMHLIILFLPPRSSNHQYFLHHNIKWYMNVSGNVDVLHSGHRKWFFSRHVQFHSGFHVIATNEISCNRPEVISSLPYDRV